MYTQSLVYVKYVPRRKNGDDGSSHWRMACQIKQRARIYIYIIFVYIDVCVHNTSDITTRNVTIDVINNAGFRL